MTYDFRSVGPGFRQAQKGSRVKPMTGIPLITVVPPPPPLGKFLLKPLLQICSVKLNYDITHVVSITTIRNCLLAGLKRLLKIQSDYM
jgi:hypothetical protein